MTGSVKASISDQDRRSTQGSSGGDRCGRLDYTVDQDIDRPVFLQLVSDPRTKNSTMDVLPHDLTVSLQAVEFGLYLVSVGLYAITCMQTYVYLAVTGCNCLHSYKLAVY